MHRHILAVALVFGSVSPVSAQSCPDERDILRIMVRELRGLREQAEVGTAAVVKDRDVNAATIKTLTHERDVLLRRLKEFIPDPADPAK